LVARKSEESIRLIEANIVIILIAVVALVYMWGEFQYNRGKSVGRYMGVLTLLSHLHAKKVINIRDNGDTYHLNADGSEGELLWNKTGFQK
jgi:hypothetical protein